MTNIYHITTKELWNNAVNTGIYTNPSFSEIGFFHCSDKDQVVPTLNRKYKSVKDLILLELDANKIESKIVYEDTNGKGEKHPHIYGNIPVDSVTKVWQLIPNDDGTFDFDKIFYGN